MVVGVGCATFFILRSVAPKHGQDQTQETPAAPILPTPSVANTFDRLRKDMEKNEIFTKDYAVESNGDSLRVPIEMKRADDMFTYTYTPSESMTIVQAKESSKGQLLSVIEQSFTGMSYKKQQAVQVADTETVSYVGTAAMCQVRQFTASQEASSRTRYIVGCVARESMDTQMKHITALLDLAKQSTPVRVAITMDAKEGSMQLQSFMLFYDNTDQNKTVFFATEKGELREYIGERPVPSADDQASFKMSSQMQQAVTDKKWNGFLQRYIQ